MRPTVELWTDGACSGNPGPGGWAAVLRMGERERELVGHEPRTTNNRMELQAVVEGLSALTRPCRVLVHTDSAYVRNAIRQGWIEGWQRNGWRTKAKTPVANRELWEALLEAMREHEVEWIPVKGHAGVELERALRPAGRRGVPDRMKRGVFVAPFGELADVRVVAGLAAPAEGAGWDGFFVWDHIRYSPPDLPVADPWIALTAVALATERVRLGPLVTPLSRRRPHKLARETATLDRLSGGRLVLGAGLGSDNHGEFEDFEEVVEPRERARLLDAGLERLAEH